MAFPHYLETFPWSSIDNIFLSGATVSPDAEGRFHHPYPSLGHLLADWLLRGQRTGPSFLRETKVPLVVLPALVTLSPSGRM